jgi:hypothetical protein
MENCLAARSPRQAGFRASANSTRHSLLARNLVLDDESKETFAILHQQYIDRINPTDGIEIGLVEELAATSWRQRRLLAIETRLFNQAAAKRTEPDVVDSFAGAFSDLSRCPEFHVLDRYESRLHRMFQRTLKNIQLIRQIEHTDPSTGELTDLSSAPATTSVLAPGENRPTGELPNEPKSQQLPVESEPYPITSGGADLSLLPTGPMVPLPPTGAKIQEVPNEPKSEQLPIESEPHPTTSGGADLSLLPTVPLPPAVTKIHQLPNEPRSEQPTARSTPHPTTSTAKFEPVSQPVFAVDPATGQFKRIA